MDSALTAAEIRSYADRLLAADDAESAADLANGQGLCEACNHAKQAPGWREPRFDKVGPGRYELIA